MSQKAIDAAILAHLCDPDTRNGFELEGHSLRNVVSGRIYPIRDGIPLFISTVSGANLKQMNFYDRVAPMYDLFTRGAREKLYPAAIAELEIEPGMRLLEVAIGTGATLPYLPQNVELFGLDISLHMLRKCRKNLEHHHRSAHLFHAEACRLHARFHEVAGGIVDNIKQKNFAVARASLIPGGAFDQASHGMAAFLRRMPMRQRARGRTDTEVKQAA